MNYALNRHTHYLHKLRRRFDTACGYYVSDDAGRWERLDSGTLPVKGKLCSRCFKVPDV